MKIEQVNELTKSAYTKTAEKYHTSFNDELNHKEYDRSILTYFSELTGINSLICDAGCGPSGHMGKYLAAKGNRVIGIDFCSKCVEMASAFNPEMEFKIMDMSNTGFANNQFDGIVAYYSIIHTPKSLIKNIFTEFYRILKPGGKLLIVVKKGEEESIIDNEWYEGNKVYFSHFREAEICAYFTETDFSLDFLDTRKPYDFELKVERIYGIGTKK